MNLSQAVKLACVSSAGVECNMVNFPSLLRMDDGGGGRQPRAGAGSGARTGTVLGLRRSSFSSKTL